MSAEEVFTPEEATPTQTINTFRIAADMFLAGKDLAMQRLNTPPFAPSLRELGIVVTNAAPELDSLTEWQRSFLMVNGAIQTHALLSQRAQYQTKYNYAPDAVTRNLLDAIRSASGGQLRFEPNRVKFKWSLFSVGLILPEQEFGEALEFNYGKRLKGVLGFVGFFGTEVGRMPFILKGREDKRTTWHEDIHVFREKMGLSAETRHSMEKIVQMPQILRAVNGENIEPGDLNVCESAFDAILEDARQINREELATSLWIGEIPVVGDIDNPQDHKDLYFMLINVANCIYAPATGFSEEQILNKSFETQMKVGAVALERARMYRAARQAISQYKAIKNPWGLAAARATVIPPYFSPRLFETIMLGRHAELEDKPRIDKGLALGTVLAAHARRMTLPSTYGLGEAIPKELVAKFNEKIVQIVNIDRKFARLLEDYRFTAEDLQSAKKWLVKFAGKSVPNGFRGSVQKSLSESLIF